MSDDCARYVEIKDEETLRAVVAHWQKVLRLQDWEVRAYFSPSFDLDKNALAQCYTHAEKRMCDIPFLSVDERAARARESETKRFMRMETMEQSAVHELLHIYTAQCGLNGLEETDPKRVAMEQMVDAIAGALTSLHSYFRERA